VGIILLHDRPPTFYAYNVHPYLRLGIARGHVDADIIAAVCLAGAKAQGCEQISVGLTGLLPRTYTIREVEEAIRKNPAKYRGWVRPPPVNVIDRARRRLISRFHLPGF
jgi:hypothetical protein